MLLNKSCLKYKTGLTNIGFKSSERIELGDCFDKKRG